MGSDAGQVVASMRPSKALFRVALRPGKYMLEAKGTGQQSNEITVRAGQYSRAIFALVAHSRE